MKNVDVCFIHCFFPCVQFGGENVQYWQKWGRRKLCDEIFCVCVTGDFFRFSTNIFPFLVALFSLELNRWASHSFKAFDFETKSSQ